MYRMLVKQIQDSGKLSEDLIMNDKSMVILHRPNQEEIFSVVFFFCRF